MADQQDNQAPQGQQVRNQPGQQNQRQQDRGRESQGPLIVQNFHGPVPEDRIAAALAPQAAAQPATAPAPRLVRLMVGGTEQFIALGSRLTFRVPRRVPVIVRRVVQRVSVPVAVSAPAPAEQMPQQAATQSIFNSRHPHHHWVWMTGFALLLLAAAAIAAITYTPPDYADTIRTSVNSAVTSAMAKVRPQATVAQPPAPVSQAPAAQPVPTRPKPKRP